MEKLNPWFVTGLVDGEGCFSVFLNTEKRKRKKQISVYRYWGVVFSLCLVTRDKKVLDQLKDFFGCGTLTTLKFPKAKEGLKRMSSRTTYQVRARKDLLERILPHFENYPLQTTKKRDFELWAEAVRILSKADKGRKTRFESQALTEEGQQRLAEIRRLMAEKLVMKQRRTILRGIKDKKPGKTVEALVLQDQAHLSLGL